MEKVANHMQQAVKVHFVRTLTMRKTVLICSILFISNLLNGQENKISIGVLGSVDIYNFDFKSYDGFDHTYEIKPAYGFGLGFQYNFNERLFLKSGLLYSQKSYTLNYSFKYMDEGDPLIPRETNLKVNYLDIPVSFGYYLLNGEKIKLSSSLGIVGEFLIGNNESSVFEDNSERESEFLNQNLNQILMATQMNIAFEYHLNTKLFFTIEPYFRYGFNNIDDEIMDSNPLSYGGILSIDYKLK